MSAPGLGALVAIEGVVIGRSEFAQGRPTFLVQFERCGRTEQLWFHAAEVVVDEDDVEAEVITEDAE
jgi:hypothetical protein